MRSKAIRQIHAAQVQVQFGRIVQEVITTDVPIISLRDLKRLWPAERIVGQASERERVRMALQAVGLLSEPTPQEVAEVQTFKTQHPPQDQERILTE